MTCPPSKLESNAYYGGRWDAVNGFQPLEKVSRYPKNMGEHPYPDITEVIEIGDYRAL